MLARGYASPGVYATPSPGGESSLELVEAAGIEPFFSIVKKRLNSTCGTVVAVKIVPSEQPNRYKNNTYGFE